MSSIIDNAPIRKLEHVERVIPADISPEQRDVLVKLIAKRLSFKEIAELDALLDNALRG